MKKILVSLSVLAFFICGCTQPPRQLESVQMKASVSPSDPQKYSILIEGIVYNESSSTVFSDYGADIVINGKDGKPVLTIPSQKKDVFPFATVQIKGNVVVEKDTFSRLVSEFGLADPAVKKDAGAAEEPDGVMIPESQVTLDKLNYTKKNIEALIQGGSK